MEMQMRFAGGIINGDGRDWVGPFIITGQYTLADGSCHWTKQYIRKHTVYYRGFNEGKGIWGTWEMPNEPPQNRTGGFHIWPEGMADPTAPHATESVEEPIIIEDVADVKETDKVPVGVGDEGKRQ
jgi:hypothetical protein